MANAYLENLMQNNSVNVNSSNYYQSNGITTDDYTDLSTSYKKNITSTHKLTESSQSGGYEEIGLNNTQRPTGGFPPIFKCIREEITKQEEKKDRGFATKETAVSIKEIMQHRRDETPFSL